MYFEHAARSTPLSGFMVISEMYLVYFAVTDNVRVVVLDVLGVSTHESMAVADAGGRGVDTHHCLH